MSKKSILFVYDSMMPGGSTTSLLSLLNALPKDKYDIDLLLYINEGAFLEQIPEGVHLLQPAYAHSRKLSTIQKMGCSIFNGELFKYFGIVQKNNMSSKKDKRSVLAQLSVEAQVSLSRKITKKYDVAIGFMELWADAFVASEKVSATKKIAWVHCDYSKSGLIGEIDEGRWKAFQRIALVSDACLYEFTKIFPEQRCKCFVASNILSQELVRNRAGEFSISTVSSTLNIVSVCRIDFNSKGLDRAIKAMYNYSRMHDISNLKWCIIGDGPNKDAFAELIKQYHLEGNVQMRGMLSNPLEIEKDYDVFFLPSRYEGKPMAVTEALMLGLPCIVTEYASAREQIEDGRDGFVFENSDSGVFQAIEFMAEHKNDIRDMKEKILEHDYSEIEAVNVVTSVFEI